MPQYPTVTVVNATMTKERFADWIGKVSDRTKQELVNNIMKPGPIASARIKDLSIADISVREAAFEDAIIRSPMVQQAIADICEACKPAKPHPLASAISRMGEGWRDVRFGTRMTED